MDDVVEILIDIAVFGCVFEGQAWRERLGERAEFKEFVAANVHASDYFTHRRVVGDEGECDFRLFELGTGGGVAVNLFENDVGKDIEEMLLGASCP